MSYGITDTIGTESARADSLHSVVVPSEKSKAFFAKLLARRQTPGNCVRCGHKNPQPKHKTCPKCLAAVRRRKLAALQKPCEPKRADIEAMQQRISSLETAVANLQISHNKIYQRAYHAGQQSIRKTMKAAAREIERLEACRYADVMPTITAQELSTINHAYDRQ